ncbi:MAG: M48 family metallopeptidase [Spirochaetes bacterium]|nr:M48 family metallopeptidase [Spirochaetota bacterium]
MNKTFKELFIFLAILIITFGIGFGLVKLINHKISISKKEKKDPGIAIEWELKLKELIKNQVIYDHKIIIDSTVKYSIDRIKDHLVSNLEDNTYDIEIIVIDSPVVNAACFPGGLIIVYSGLIKISDNPEEIAAILAHELGHVMHRDSVNALMRQFGIAILFSIITRSDSNIIENIIKTLINVKFSQEVEKRADEFCFELMIKSSINPIHFANIFKRMKKKEITSINKEILKYISTHPDTDFRISNAEKKSRLFRGEEHKFNFDWKKVKKALPSVFDY